MEKLEHSAGQKMIDQATLIVYVGIVLGVVVIPGPAMLLTIARATSSGTKVGVATGAGIAVGDVVHTAMAIVGISAVIAASAVLFSLIKYLGAAYLIYLGIRALVDKSTLDFAAKTPPLTAGRAFRQAIVTELLNPKTALFFLAFLPQFIKPENGNVFMQLTILGLIYVVLGLMETVAVAIGAGGLGRFLRRNPMIARWQGKVVGGIYCALGIRLALQER